MLRQLFIKIFTIPLLKRHRRNARRGLILQTLGEVQKTVFDVNSFHGIGRAEDFQQSAHLVGADALVFIDQIIELRADVGPHAHAVARQAAVAVVTFRAGANHWYEAVVGQAVARAGEAHGLEVRRFRETLEAGLQSLAAPVELVHVRVEAVSVPKVE